MSSGSAGSLAAVRAFATQVVGAPVDGGLPIPATPPTTEAAVPGGSQVERAIKFARRLERLKAAGEIDWAPQARELLAFHKIEQAFGTLVAVRNLYGIALEECGDEEKLTVELEAQFGFSTATRLEVQSAHGVQTARRPDGSVYVCRTIAGMTDVALLRACRAHGIFVRLYGPPGTGKTALAEAAFGTQVITTECDEGTSSEAIVGGWVPMPGGGFDWRDGDLTACLKGATVDGHRRHVWFCDDITAAPASVLPRTYPALDGRGRLTLKEHLGETVAASDGFYALCAYNPDLPGAVLPQPLRSRFAMAIHVPTDYDAVRRLCP